MKKRKIAILLSALMLYTNISYVGIDGNAEEILLEEPETLLNESTEKETEIVPAGRIEIEEITVTDEPEDLLPEETESEEQTETESEVLESESETEPKMSEEESEIWDAEAESETETESGIELYETKTDGDSGSCGEQVTWNYDPKTKKLVLDGTGTTFSYHAFGNGNLPWNDYKKEITSVEVKEGITALGNEIFSELENATEIQLPDSLQSIGEDCFAYSGFTAITIPDSVTEIGLAAFSGCEALKQIEIPGNVKEIHRATFGRCESLERIIVRSKTCIFEEGEITGDSYALKEVACYEYSSAYWYFYDTGVEIELLGTLQPGDEGYVPAIEYSYDEMTKTLTISGSRAIKNYYGNTPWSAYKGKTEILVIQNGITGIGYQAFSEFTALKRVELPSSVASIEERAFANCTALQSLIVPDGVKWIGNGAFSNCSSLETITLPDSSITYYDSLFRITVYGNEGTAAEHLAAEKDVEFKSLSRHEHTYQKSYHIGTAQECWYCTICGAETEGLLDGTCGKNAVWKFDEDTGTLTISGSGEVKKSNIWYTFANRVKKVVVEAGITSLQGASFYHSYPNLVRVELPDSIKKIEYWTFSECTSLSEIVLPDGITEIGQVAFNGCQSLKTMKIPDTVTKIGCSAFERCSSLEEVRLPQNLTEMEYAVFSGCEKLQDILIPGSLESLEMRMFENCTSLRNVTIENGVQTIGIEAFENCVNLKEIEIPESVSYVGNSAFRGCTGLKSVTFSGETTTIAESAFSDCGSFTVCGYSDSTAEAYAKAHNLTFKSLHTHVWEAAGVKMKPTCTKTGINYMKCSGCGRQKEVTVNALGHKYANGKCVRCGAWQKISLRTCTASISSSAYTYRGSEIRPTVTVKNGSKVLKKGTDYTVTYRSNKEIGKAYVIIQGKERYSGSRTLTFKIQPKGTSFVQAKSSASGRMQLSWKKVTDVSGYQIRLRTGGTSEIRTRVGDTKLSTVLTGLKKGTTYRISIRTYQMIDGQRYYSWWSKEEAVPVKK